MERTFKVPASWMRVSVLGPYRIEPCINPKCPTERASREWLFYRLTRRGEHVSDHGDRRGAMYAAMRLIEKEREHV